MKERKRPPTAGMVSFRAPADMIQQLEELAEREERTLADVVRRIVRQGLPARKGPKK